MSWTRLCAGIAIAFTAALAASACGNKDDSTGSGAVQAAPDAIPKGDAGRRMYFEKRCKEGHYGLCGELGLMWERGWGGAKDKAKADEYRRLACDFAVVDSCTALGVELTPDMELGILDKKCAAGSAFACNNQGQLLVTGTGVAADPAKARPLLEKGCKGGFPSSCRALSNMWGQGLGVTKDEAKQKEYKAKADALDAEISALEAKYFHIPPRDQLPIGHASQGLIQSLKGDKAAQNEMNEKILESAAKKLGATVDRDAGPEPKK
jgi:TPR repeat protein